LRKISLTIASRLAIKIETVSGPCNTCFWYALAPAVRNTSLGVARDRFYIFTTTNETFNLAHSETREGADTRNLRLSPATCWLDALKLEMSKFSFVSGYVLLTVFLLYIHFARMASHAAVSQQAGHRPADCGGIKWLRAVFNYLLLILNHVRNPNRLTDQTID